ncbi:uncharacterized protein LY89DRAFT_664023 [Mollisia scopiformis]|uniref:Uncharacterized protein n=1 Tax=Mollisia scopiformis TaxID=149040 RepID=A0A194XUA6_MOLSC|nr:uncharacterized protein LY89DRAFT_664023 [Mollisia scopiformis]KUJ23619.1 hypothetical protein LY89DRAFT_664023 [Mollisia scopiformis]
MTPFMSLNAIYLALAILLYLLGYFSFKPPKPLHRSVQLSALKRSLQTYPHFNKNKQDRDLFFKYAAHFLAEGSAPEIPEAQDYIEFDPPFAIFLSVVVTLILLGITALQCAFSAGLGEGAVIFSPSIDRWLAPTTLVLLRAGIVIVFALAGMMSWEFGWATRMRRTLGGIREVCLDGEICKCCGRGGDEVVGEKRREVQEERLSWWIQGLLGKDEDNAVEARKRMEEVIMPVIEKIRY